jgi:catechol 2,3-dioxygenase-like lactoylglutathione lyase family enzyme
LKIDHIALKVSNLDIAEGWYTKSLDAEVVYRDEKYIRLKCENTYIALIDEKHYPHNHVGFLVNDIKDLPAEHGEVVKHRDGTIGVYVKDPFENYIEYIWYSEEAREVFLK